MSGGTIPLIEAAVESLEAALAAQAGGADRIELCTDLAHGGTTPAVELLRESVSRLSIPIFVLVRARAGDFSYTAAEHRLMLEQIEHAKQAGAHGIVTGALTLQRELDEVRTAELLEAARPLHFTFHRAFDACRDRRTTLESLIRLGVERVLTSGGATTAPEGVHEIRRLVIQAKGRIEILPGGGVTAENVIQLVQQTGVREIHFSANDPNKVRIIRELLFSPPSRSPR